MKNKNVHAVGGIPIVESRKKSLGIYVHIPFCRSKCEYCDFYSIPGARSKELMTRYLDAVIAHIRESCALRRWLRGRHGLLRRRHAVVFRSDGPEPESLPKLTAALM